MAFTEFYCNASTGSNMNGGSDAGSPSFSDTNGNWNSTTGVYISGTTPTGAAVGQWANFFNDGSTTPVFSARITAVNIGTKTITTSTTAKIGTAPTTSATARSINVGGCWKGPNGAVLWPITTITSVATDASSNTPRVNFKNNATYSMTASISATPTAVFFQGYSSTAGDGGRATIDGGTAGASYTQLSVTSNRSVFVDLIFSNNGATGTASCIDISGLYNEFIRVTACNARGHAINLSGGTTCNTFVECETYGWGKAGVGYNGFNLVMQQSSFAILSRCIAHDPNSADTNAIGFNIYGHCVLDHCIADTCTGYGVSLITVVCTQLITNCTFYKNGNSGINIAIASTTLVIQNCVFSDNTGYGIISSVAGVPVLINNAYFNNSLGETSALTGTCAALVEGSITCASAPLMDPVNGDFRPALSSVIGTGRSSFQMNSGSYSKTTATTMDIGAVQSKPGAALIF